MTPPPATWTQSAQLMLALITFGGVVLSAVATAGVTWGLVRAEIKAAREESRVNRAAMLKIRETLGLEPVGGEIKTSFPTRRECRLLEERSDKRIGAVEEKVGDHEHRLTAIETRIEATG